MSRTSASFIVLDSCIDNEMSFSEAIEMSDVQIAQRVVLKRGFNVNSLIDGKTPAEWCVITGNVEILNLLFYTYAELFDDDYDYTTLFQAARQELRHNDMIWTDMDFYTMIKDYSSDKDALFYLTGIIKNIVESEVEDI